MLWKKLKTVRVRTSICRRFNSFFSRLSFLSFRFFLFQMASISSVPSFSAYYAHKRAACTATRLSQTMTATKECSTCQGSGKMSFSMDTLDGNTRVWTKSVGSIPCVHCKEGKVSPIKELYSKLVWCACKHGRTSSHLLANDGVRVFGKKTYLCSSCGFVKQFG